MNIKISALLVLLAVLAALLLNLDARDSVVVADTSNGPYREYPARREGIGREYLGREISQVMGHLGAAWLERPEREREERTDLLLDALPLTPAMHVADIGAGTGYFSFPVAARLPAGRLFAVDIQPEMLAIVRQRAAERAVSNVEPVLGTETDPQLAPGSIDLAFIVDAYHEFSYPFEMGTALAAALKPGGRLVLVEYRGEDATVRIKRLHKMTAAQAKKEMAAIGLVWEETLDVLPQQHILVFRKPLPND